MLQFHLGFCLFPGKCSQDFSVVSRCCVVLQFHLGFCLFPGKCCQDFPVVLGAVLCFNFTWGSVSFLGSVARIKILCFNFTCGCLFFHKCCLFLCSFPRELGRKGTWNILIFHENK